VCSAGTILNFTPSPDITGNPGDFAGWGYTMQDSDGFAVPTFSEFDASPSLGVYIDFVSLGSNFVVAPPTGLPQGQDFDPVNQTGVGEFFLFPSDTDTITGTLTLHYDLYENDPNIDPSSFLSGDNTVSEDVSITLQQPIADTPEPGTVGLVLGGLALCLAARRRHPRL
jgi:hypothetical protein